ncbi:MAG: leucine-rich repeat protein [Muribaculaceae bacterium]|nr:leucine-rich repeat protein [Muribaculaceae bacterium]
MRLKKQTKLFKWLLPLMLVLMLPQIASAYDFKENKLCYNYNEDGTSVTVTYERLPSYFMQSSYLNLSGNLNIPEIVTHNGTDYLVTAIGYSAFEYCTGLNSVVSIPNSVTSIGNGAFHGCSNVSSVTIPNSVTSIGNGAFNGCDDLISVTIPNSVTSIGDNVFTACASLTSVTIPNSVTSIGYSAFSACIGLTSITIPNSVTSIGSTAFNGCTSLTSVTIPNSVTSIGEWAFSDCTSLNSVTLSGYGAWNYNISSHNGLGQIINQLRTVIIGSGITVLGDFGFTPNVVNCYAENPPVCSEGTFANYDGELHVPTTSIASYFMADYWQNFYNLQNDLSKVALDKTNVNLVQWETLALTATVTPQGEGEIVWSTTNPSVATVDENGIVTAINEGECDIYATLATSNDAAYAKCHITVSYPEITISLSEDSLVMNLGDEHELFATITPDDTGLIPTWSSSDESVATVENGVVTVVGDGECDITATILDKTATCHVTVINNLIISLNVDKAIIGASQMLTVYPSCTPDVPVDLVVTSSDPSVAVARVINNPNASKTPALAGEKAIMIVGVQSGTATITVTNAEGQADPAVLDLRVVDVDGDRTITSTDITCLYNYLLNGDDTYITTSDTDGDGYITSTDITIIYNLLLGN